MPNLHLVPDSPETAEDADIKEIARRDRRAALDLTVRRYRERILHHALYVLKDYQEAYDVCQEVFIKAMRERRFFDESFKIKAWLFRVTSNLCFNIVRDRRRRSSLLESMPKQRETKADQLEALFRDQRQQYILQAMDQLSQAHRDILMLRYYSDLSYVEIAQALDIKLGTVMSRLSRAKSRLLDVIDDVGGLSTGS